MKDILKCVQYAAARFLTLTTSKKSMLHKLVR